MSNLQLLQAAFVIAVADEKFMGDSTKVGKAIEALTPKDGLTRVLKQLQGYGLKDFLVKKEEGKAGYTDLTKAEKVKGYVLGKFKPYMDDPKTSVKATELFNAAYPSTTAAPEEEAA
jgi:hypothetical protein